MAERPKKCPDCGALPFIFFNYEVCTICGWSVWGEIDNLKILVEEALPHIERRAKEMAPCAQVGHLERLAAAMRTVAGGQREEKRMPKFRAGTVGVFLSFDDEGCWPALETLADCWEETEPDFARDVREQLLFRARAGTPLTGRNKPSTI